MLSSDSQGKRTMTFLDLSEAQGGPLKSQDFFVKEFWIVRPLLTTSWFVGSLLYSSSFFLRGSRPWVHPPERGREGDRERETERGRKREGERERERESWLGAIRDTATHYTHVAVCCSVSVSHLRGGRGSGPCCNTQQRTATHCNQSWVVYPMGPAATQFNTLQHITTHCNKVLSCVPRRPCCHILQQLTQRNTLQHSLELCTPWTMLQHIATLITPATHCITLQPVLSHAPHRPSHSLWCTHADTHTHV